MEPEAIALRGSALDADALRAAYPDLFATVGYGPVTAHFEVSDTLPQNHLIGNINIVPFINDDVVVLRVAGGRPEIPGGTLEPDEICLDTLRRELREEAGADLLSFTVLGAWRSVSAAAQPYRPHLPHPEFFRVVGYGDVTLTGPPTNPAGGEQIVAVEPMLPGDAERLFQRWSRPDLAALIRYAATRRAAEGPV